MTPRTFLLVNLVGLAVATAAHPAPASRGASAKTRPAEEEAARARLQEVMRASFKAHGQAGLDRLDQDELQAACSRAPAEGPLPAAAAKRLVAAQQKTLVYPPDGVFLGDWKRGEAVAQNGVGKQYSDDPAKGSGGNCYACHQLSREEVSFGTLGPSLRHYGKLRGSSPAMQRYTYAKIYNPQAFTACSTMPRFGHHAVLTEQQIKDLVALLLDPASPVNQ
jgi:sulfur-oxidizing protein SoxX